ncbi:MAG: DnaJ C-terminal domain-containing protein, partial [Solirubrobacterales bacterium]
RIPESPCTACDGRGRVVARRELEVEVPAGIADGQRIRLAGQGHAGEPGAPPGDLYVQVAVEELEGVVRDGDDLVAVIDLSAPAASLGAVETVEGVDGPVEVEVPAGTQPGEVITVRHRGMPQLRRPERRGDLRAVVNVIVPRSLDDSQRELTVQLAEALGPENLERGEGLGGKLRRLFGGGR